MRGKGEGSVYKRASDGRWAGVLELPPRPDNPRPRKVVTAKDKATVIRKLAEAKAQLEAHGDLPTASQTVEQWFTYWLDTVAPKTKRPKTIANYRSMVNGHVIPTIGKIRLDKLGPAHVRRVHDAVTAKRSSTTALTVHAIMSSAFRDAYRDGRISRNPAALTAAPRKARTELHALTVDEAIRLIQTFQDHEDGYLWATYLLTGARRGEVLGLEWDRVTDILDFSWQLQRLKIGFDAPADYESRPVRGGLVLTRPKTLAGTRVVPLVEPLLSILERKRAQSDGTGLVFTDKAGGPLDPEQVSRKLADQLRNIGIERRVRVHDLRHTTVDLLYEAGVPEPVIVELIGHSSRAVTRSYRALDNRPQKVAAMTRLSDLLGISPADH